MSALNETETQSVAESPAVDRSASSGTISFGSVVTRILTLLSSVRFGIIVLILLIVGSMMGMLIEQQNVEGFEKYFQGLTPSEQSLGSQLGLFDIYHTWYFSLLLLVLSLNIILASIDRFPKAWTFVSRKKLDASKKWLLGQQFHAEVEATTGDSATLAKKLADVFRTARFKPIITEKNGRTFVFAERSVWNRLGAYAVHVALLTIFTGFFLTTQFGHEGQMMLQPGSKTSVIQSSEVVVDKSTGSLGVKQASFNLPFTVTCTDIQQTLIRPEGSILSSNTMDWLTQIKINDQTGEHSALVHLNEPYDYGGYRFYQASFISNGKARSIKLRLTPESGSQPIFVTIPRNGSTTLADGTRIDFKQFYSEFTVGGNPDQMGSADYNNPVAQLEITPSQGQPIRAFAFPMDLPDNAPVGKAVGGYKLKLVDFEKAPLAHILSVKKDPGKAPFYIGGLMLIMCLGAVFFFSHQRIWALIEHLPNGSYEIALGGNTNRNKLGFEDRFKAIVESLKSKVSEVQQS